MRLFSFLAALFASLAVSAAWAAPGPVTPDDMTLGAPAAKVTMIEYASTACPHCAAWNQDVWPAFKAKYVDTGKVFYVYREIVTEPAQLGVAGPLIARCAGKARYFAALDAFFRAQGQMYGGQGATAALERVGAGVGLDKTKLMACLTDKAATDALFKRAEGYARSGDIHSTPTFVFYADKYQGVKLEGEQDISAFDTVYELISQ